MSEHRLTIPVRPKPKGRPRFARGRAYTPKDTVEFERLVAAAWVASGGPCFAGPVEVTASFTIDGIEVTIRELEPETKSPLRGDLDNYLKAVMDGLNGIAFGDDRQVHRLSADKA